MPVEPEPTSPKEPGPEAPSVASAPSPAEATIATPRKRPSRRRLAFRVVAGLLLVWLVMAYVLMPAVWKRYTRRHPSLADIPGVTHTGNGIPGDPLNVALVGTEEDVMKIMVAAKWYPADPLTLRSCLRIAAASVLRRPYDAAPVSNLYLFGRKEDLAFEQPVGNDPRKRHHVRFWQSDKVDFDGRPVWVGSAIFDERVGLSRDTGQITHFIAADIDAERDYLFHDLERTGDLLEKFIIEGFHQIREGRNGGGHPWHTDGNASAGVIKSAEPK
jgi:hypothetical protein